MPKVKVYNTKGEIVKEMDLNPKIFDVKPKEGVIHQVAVAMAENQRQVLAHTKTKAEVRGGGRKPWRQKGTGRARHGSIRSPLWVGGGVTFGPRKDRAFKQKINKKIRRKALFMILSEKVADNKIIAIEGLKLEKIKTKEAQQILNKLPLNHKKTLLLIPQKDEILIKSFKNISNIKTTRANDINVLELLKYQYLLVPTESFGVIEKSFLSAK